MVQFILFRIEGPAWREQKLIFLSDFYNSRRVISELERLNLADLPRFWVKHIWENEFTDLISIDADEHPEGIAVLENPQLASILSAVRISFRLLFPSNIFAI